MNEYTDIAIAEGLEKELIDYLETEYPNVVMKDKQFFSITNPIEKEGVEKYAKRVLQNFGVIKRDLSRKEVMAYKDDSYGWVRIFAVISNPVLNKPCEQITESEYKRIEVIYVCPKTGLFSDMLCEFKSVPGIGELRTLPIIDREMNVELPCENPEMEMSF